jgi:hypothetical protein
MQMKRLMARLACYQQAIVAARQAGMTWMEIGDRMGVPGEAARKAFARATAAMQTGRLVPLEQAPLPDPQATATVRIVTAKPYTPGPLTGEQQQERPARPGWTNIPIDKPLK